MKHTKIAALLGLTFALALSSAAQDATHRQGDVGYHGRLITTSSSEAQELFDRGMQLAFAFGHADAAASFVAAQEKDPQCAMCFWGEAWALGPNINAAMNYDNAVRAYNAIQNAMARKENASKAEQAIIEATLARYHKFPSDNNRAALDKAYADALREVVHTYPQDLDANTFFAEALMLLSPWDYYMADGEVKPHIAEALVVLETVLDKDIGHPGSCHLYIHAVEASSRPERAEPCADQLAASIPDASHIQHMPSHVYVRTGRYGDAVRRNQEARIRDQRAAHGEAFAIYPMHNVEMLIFAAWLDGQGAIAMHAAEDLARIDEPSSFYYPLMLVRFGRWNEILEIDEPDIDTLNTGVWHFSTGMAKLRLNDKSAAKEHLSLLEGYAKELSDEKSYGYIPHKQKDILTLAHAILSGEIATEERRFDDAVNLMEKAVLIEDAFPYIEPQIWPIPVRHHLGVSYLQAGRYREAEETYREELDRHRNNGWSLLGLTQSLQAQGRDQAAAVVRKQFDEAWARADVWIPGSKF